MLYLDWQIISAPVFLLLLLLLIATQPLKPPLWRSIVVVVAGLVVLTVTVAIECTRYGPWTQSAPEIDKSFTLTHRTLFVGDRHAAGRSGAWHFLVRLPFARTSCAERSSALKGPGFPSRMIHRRGSKVRRNNRGNCWLLSRPIPRCLRNGWQKINMKASACLAGVMPASSGAFGLG